MSRNLIILDVVLLAVALVGGDRGRAQPVEADAPAPEKADAGVSDSKASIAGARKDLEAVKSLRSFGSAPKGGTPALAVPRMQTESTAVPLAPKRGTLEGEKRTATWLLDAMDKRAPAKGARGAEARLPETGAVEQRRDRRDERLPFRIEKGGYEHGGPVNPFSRYLGDWISPQDYALLKPVVVPVGSAQDITAKAPEANSPMASVSPLSETGGKSVVGTKDSGSRFRPPGTERANPYLEVLKSPTASPLLGAAPAKPKTVSASPASAGGVTTPPEALPEVARPRTPDFARPNPDDKYFKQLKRF